MNAPQTSAATAAATQDLFITVPEVTLPNGTMVPFFQVGQYLSSAGPAGTVQITREDAPWVEINYHEAREACTQSGLKLLTELQALAIAHNIANQDINWTGSKVGEGSIYQGLRKGNVSEAQPGSYESADPDERSWHQLSNGERIYHFAGNCYSWIFDDVQGDENGIVARRFTDDSLSITTAPFPSMEKGMGWRPDPGSNWSGLALIRGGYWLSGARAGVFRLGGDFPGYRLDRVGFRCTK